MSDHSIAMKTSEVLYAAADNLEENGWTRWLRGMNLEGPHCLMGAIGHAIQADTFVSSADGVTRYSYDTVLKTPAATAFAEHIGIDLGLLPDPLFGWNDESGRTATDVVEALRACAVIQAARETADERVQVSA